MSDASAHRSHADLSALCLSVLIDLTREEHAARQAEDTLRADTSYHLRQVILDLLTGTDLSVIAPKATAIAAQPDGPTRAQMLLKALRNS